MPSLRRLKSTEDFEQDLRKALNVADFEGFIATHLSKRNDMKKLNRLYKGHTDAEYEALLKKLADKLTNRIEDDFPQSFDEAVDTIEKQERDITKEKQEVNNGNGVKNPAISPNTPLDASISSAPGSTSAPSASGDHKSVPGISPSQPGLSVPTNQQVSSAAGHSSVSPVPTNTLPTPPNLQRKETQSTIVESIFSHDDQSSSGSITTAGTPSIGNNGIQELDVTPNSLPPPEELELEYAAYAEDFIRRNFTGLLDPDNPDFKETMRNAARKAKEIMTKYDITPQDAKKLTKLALYDFAILCDDSWSMMEDENEEGEDRITPLKATLGRISEIATIIEPSGISIRFLNYKNDSTGWDNLTSREFIEKQWSTVEENWGGITQLGQKVNEKIIQPMVIQKIHNGTFKKPLIVVAITDGAPTGEPDDAFKQAIVECKGSKEIMAYGEAAVIFIISRVGSDKYARRFLSGLKKSKELSEWVYCSMDRLDDNSAVMQRATMIGEAQGDKEYAKKLLKIFLAALGQQTK